MTRPTHTALLEAFLAPHIAAGAAKGQSPSTAIQHLTGDYRSLASLRKKAAALDAKCKQIEQNAGDNPA